MNGISGVKNHQVSMNYNNLSSGKRINKAADDAAGLIMAQKMQKQSTGLNAGSENASMGKSLTNVADGALGGMNDYLMRIKELSVKAASGLNSADSLQAIQSEINQNLAGIQDLAKGTEFNTMKLLDGSMASVDIATNPDGTGMKIQMANTTLDALGISGYDVTKGFDMDVIDKAISMVSSARSSMGASANALESAYSYNTGAALEQTSAQSKLEDLDIPKAVSEQKKDEILNQYKSMIQKQQLEQQNPLLKYL